MPQAPDCRSGKMNFFTGDIEPYELDPPPEAISVGILSKLNLDRMKLSH